MPLYSKYTIQTAPDKLSATREITPALLQPTPAAKTVAALPPPPPPPPMIVVPNYKLGPWDTQIQLFRGPDATGKTYSILTAYVLNLIALQAYGLDGITDPFMADWLGSAPPIATDIAGNLKIKYVRWNMEGGRAILSFSCLAKAKDLKSARYDDWSPYPDLNPQWYFFQPIGTYLRAVENALLPALAEEFKNGHGTVLTTGHDLGGIVAAWIANRLNSYTPTVGTNAQPVAACYGFGMPSAFQVIFGGTPYDFRPGFTCVNVRVPNDPIPTIVQWWGTLAGRYTAFGMVLDPMSIPQVDFDVLLTTRVSTCNEMQNSLKSAFPISRAKNADKTEELITYLMPFHDIGNYIATMDAYCRASGQTPTPWYQLLYETATIGLSGGGNF
jgi:hypothetical protein